MKRLYANAEAEIEVEIVVDELRTTGHDDEFYESELLPVFGTCVAKMDLIVDQLTRPPCIIGLLSRDTLAHRTSAELAT